MGRGWVLLSPSPCSVPIWLKLSSSLAQAMNTCAVSSAAFVSGLSGAATWKLLELLWSLPWSTSSCASAPYAEAETGTPAEFSPIQLECRCVAEACPPCKLPQETPAAEKRERPGPGLLSGLGSFLKSLLSLLSAADEALLGIAALLAVGLALLPKGVSLYRRDDVSLGKARARLALYGGKQERAS